jgi:hypothetical protein
MRQITLSEENRALVPVEERTVDFYGDEITAVLIQIEDKSQIYIPIKPISDYLGLSWSGQFERIKRDPVLSEVIQGIRVTRIPVGGVQETLGMPLEYLPGWLFGINAARVKPELREKIIRYQRDCFKVLWEAFQQGTFAPAETSNLSTPTTSLVQIREMGFAIAHLAEQQIAMEQNVNSRLDQAGKLFNQFQKRLGVLENKLSPSSLITDEQAEEVSAAVKALAEYMTGKDKSKNHYQGIFAELYRRFKVSSYKNIRADQYAPVLKFLDEWRKAGDQNSEKQS